MPRCAHPASARERLFAARDYITEDRFEIVRCRICGWTLTWPPPDAAGMARHYPAGYHGEAGGRRFPRLVELLQQALHGTWARLIERSQGGQTGRVLDIGCGRGGLLREFRRRDWEVQGLELNEWSAAHAREVLNLPVHVGPMERLPWPDGHFDAVILWHVLEHLPDPQAALTEARRVLRNGGTLLVGVPNFGSAEARMAQDKWFHLDVPRHLTHWTRATLGAALAGAGFDAQCTSCFAPEYDGFSFTQSALNALGLRHNLLYNLLRGRRAKVIQKGGTFATLLTVLLAGPLALLSVPAILLAGWLRTGATMTWLAVKRP